MSKTPEPRCYINFYQEPGSRRPGPNVQLCDCKLVETEDENRKVMLCLGTYG